MGACCGTAVGDDVKESNMEPKRSGSRKKNTKNNASVQRNAQSSAEQRAKVLAATEARLNKQAGNKQRNKTGMSKSAVQISRVEHLDKQQSSRPKTEWEVANAEAIGSSAMDTREKA